MSVRNARSGKIQTVRGCISPNDLGSTLMHEHLLCNMTPPAIAALEIEDVEITLENCWNIRHNWGMRDPVDLRLESEKIAEAEVHRFREAGGKTIVELTCQGISPNPQGLRRLSEAAGVHIVMGVGYYTEEFQNREVLGQSEDYLAKTIIDALEVEPSDGTPAPGIIGEIGCSHPWTDFERRSLRAAAIAQRETGFALNIHPGRHPKAPFEHLALVKESGGDPTRTIISHVDRTILNLDLLLRLADTGCMIEFDFFGIESSYFVFDSRIDLPNDGMRLNFIRQLLNRNHIHQILISQDICTKTRLCHFGGHGYAHILKNVVPLMRAKGFSDDELTTILVENPRRCLTCV